MRFRFAIVLQLLQQRRSPHRPHYKSRFHRGGAEKITAISPPVAILRGGNLFSVACSAKMRKQHRVAPRKHPGRNELSDAQKKRISNQDRNLKSV
jgi:hypothetical protein